MRHRGRGERIVEALCFILLATIAACMPIQSDTWWHLRAGMDQALSRSVLLHDTFSYTAAGAFWWNHSWLSQWLLYGGFSLGGLPLVGVAAAAAAMGSLVFAWRLSPGSVLDRVLLFSVAFPSLAATWAVRPQLLSTLLLVVVLRLLRRGTRRYVPLVFLLWANLHAGFVLGLAAVGADFAAGLLRREPDAWSRGAAWAVAIAMTFVTPLGPSMWVEIAASLGRSRAHQIAEWLPPSFSGQHAFFWLLGAAFVGITAVRARRLADTTTLALVLTTGVALVLALGAQRQIGPFALVAALTISHLLWAGEPTDAGARHGRVPPGLGGAGLLAVGAAGTAAALAVAWSWTDARLRPDWRPISPDAAAAMRACPAPIYNHYNDGGYLIWFVPEQRVFLDSRQDPFPPELILEQQEAERTGEFSRLFSRYGINCVVAGPESRAGDSLESGTWQRTYRDSRWQVWARSEPVPAR